MSHMNDFWNKYKRDFGRVGGAIFAAVVVFALQRIFFPTPSDEVAEDMIPIQQRLDDTRFLVSILVALGAGTLVMLIWQAFSLRKRVGLRLERLEQWLWIILRNARSVDFERRRGHFRDEKELLCKSLADNLASWLEQFSAEGTFTGIDVVIDSGTTLEPLFPRLKERGFGKLGAKVPNDIHVYTNSLAGASAYSREDTTSYPISEQQFHLLGGNPLDKYQATTGEETLEALRRLGERKTKEDGTPRRLVIGILTSNWFVCGGSLGTLEFSAKGRGPPEFKKEALRICDKVIVVSPLGKILKLETTADLNDRLKQEPGGEEYVAVSLEQIDKKNVHLLTSLRPRAAFLGQHSHTLSQRFGEPSYTLATCPSFTPPGTKNDQAAIDVPHEYLQEILDEVFHLND